MEQPDLAPPARMSVKRLAVMLAAGALLTGVWRSAPEADRALRVEVAPSARAEAAIEDAVLLAEARRLGWDHTDPVIARHLITAMRTAGASGDDDALLADARALGLDREDPVVRARLLDRARRALRAAATPDRAALEAWHAAHPERFRRPEHVRYAHAFLQGDGDLGPRLGPPEDAAGLGDPLLGLRPIELATPERVGRFLGPSVEEALREAPIGAWVGPIPSPYGRHWLHVLAREPGEVPPLDVIAAEVAQDWRREAGARAAQARLERLVAAWDVTVVRR